MFGATLLLAALVANSAIDELAAIREIRLRGELDEARARAERALATRDLETNIAVELHLELARVEDRVGLHQNLRPVQASLEHVEAAAAVPGASAATIELALADYYYRAEMAERAFPLATPHADRAIELFRELGDRHGEADAVHRRGLIAFQRRKLEPARQLFERSLELDRAGGARTYFRGEYERHVGFIYLVDGDTASAIPYFERSLAARRESGAIDASMFAAISLGSALVDVGRFEEAKPHLLYSMMLAERLDSPAGKARAGIVLGQLYEKSGDGAAARSAFEMTQRVAESIGSDSIVRRAADALERLRERDP